jgi:hypothetical protein
MRHLVLDIDMIGASRVAFKLKTKLTELIMSNALENGSGVLGHNNIRLLVCHINKVIIPI